MATNSWYKAGDYNAICDVCGFEFKASKMRKNWKGLFVDLACFEPRHPQDFIRARHEDTSVPWSRPESADDYLLVCYIWDRSGYAGLGQAGCMIAGNNTYSASFLTAQKTEGT